MRLILFLMLLSCSTAYSQPTSELRSALNSVVESAIKKEFDSAISLIELNLKDDTTKKELAINGLRSLLYNKAYFYTICSNDPLEKNLPLDAVIKETEACVSAKLIDLHVHIKLAQYWRTLDRGSLLKCEWNNRLMEEEIRFKPYLFLQGNELKLFDFKNFNGCIKQQ